MCLPNNLAKIQVHIDCSICLLPKTHVSTSFKDYESPEMATTPEILELESVIIRSDYPRTTNRTCVVPDTKILEALNARLKCRSFL
jgi:hypothetical protein